MISLKIQKKLLAQVKEELLAGFGLDFTQLDEGRVIFNDNDVIAEVIFTHKETGNEVVLSSIWFDKKTGDILQSGTNYGRLTL
jgi:hypothetical protein